MKMVNSEGHSTGEGGYARSEDLGSLDLVAPNPPSLQRVNSHDLSNYDRAR